MIKNAIKDIGDTFKNFDVPLKLTILSVRKRYHRSVLGPFWMTISTGIMIFLMSTIYSRIMGSDFDHYLQYLSLGLILWIFISAFITEVCMVYIDSESIIKDVYLPYSSYILKALLSNLVVFLHNLLIIFIVLVFFEANLTFVNILTAVSGFVLVLINLFFIGLLLANICVRFRDFPPIIGTLIQISFFVTPILWERSKLDGVAGHVASMNPLYNLIQLFRKPLLGESISVQEFCIAILFTVILAGFSLLFFSKYRNRISYWL